MGKTRRIVDQIVFHLSVLIALFSRCCSDGGGGVEQIFSASNGGDGSCQLDMNSGTSMSCPIAAGAAALVRQYFVEGFYSADVEARGGLCSTFPCTEFGPSGALVKVVNLMSWQDAVA